MNTWPPSISSPITRFLHSRWPTKTPNLATLPIVRRTLKWAFIEAAHGAVRKGGRFRAIYDRRTNSGKRDKNRGYIAVARALCRVAYVCWKKQVDYSAEPPPRPGRRRRGHRRTHRAVVAQAASAKQTSRAELGQPEPPLAAAAVVGRIQASK